VLGNARGEILVSRRSEHVHQGGLWEFPGGKVEAGEAPRAALERELHEELGVRLQAARPLIRVHHDYADLHVLLDVWRVTDWSGRIHGREGQSVRWLAADALAELPMPAADVPVVTALRLPERYLITPSPGTDRQAFLAALGASVDAGVRLVALRAKALERAELIELARQAAAICHAGGARMLINGDPELLAAGDADGVHLDSTRLMSARSRPVPGTCWLAASCHDARELAQAMRIGADFVVLSPVAATPDHAQATPLGWQRFASLVEGVNLPVFALGGMGPEHLDDAWQHGAQGIAAIRALWKGSAGEPDAPPREAC
jgi:8-oxo-dGTP diphosphatase